MRVRLSRIEKRNKRKDHHRKRRIEAFKKLGERCRDCGLRSSSKNYIIFDFHHVDPMRKETKLSDAHDISDFRFWKEVAKCVLLCSNCHRLRHFEEWRKRNPERYK